MTAQPVIRYTVVATYTHRSFAKGHRLAAELWEENLHRFFPADRWTYDMVPPRRWLREQPYVVTLYCTTTDLAVALQAQACWSHIKDCQVYRSAAPARKESCRNLHNPLT